MEKRKKKIGRSMGGLTEKLEIDKKLNCPGNGLATLGWGGRGSLLKSKVRGGEKNSFTRENATEGKIALQVSQGARKNGLKVRRGIKEN